MKIETYKSNQGSVSFWQIVENKPTIYYGSICTRTGKFSDVLAVNIRKKHVPPEVLELLPKYMIKAL